MRKNVRPSINVDETINSLRTLRPGQSMTYYTGITGWLEREVENIKLLRWCLDAQASGAWIFVQKKHPDEYVTTGVQLSVFDYIAIRRMVPEPPIKNFGYPERLILK